ncbi:MAG: tetratricopeptide repeat protein, partial [Alphaproteobacteria bacterium]|nr:tetratricopeptide repeat protein [Alphaproteobacteria bacterium]
DSAAAPVIPTESEDEATAVAEQMAAEAPASAGVEPEGMELGSADEPPAVVEMVAPSEAAPPEMPPATVQTAAPPVLQETAPAANMQGTMGTAMPPAGTTPPGTNDYYDSGINLPKGAMAKDAMRVVDPKVEPGQKMIIARKDHTQGSQEALLESASRALKLQRYDAALEMYEQLYAKNKRDHRILMGLAVSQQFAGRPESAIQTYEALLDLDPRNADAMVNMLGLLRQQYPEVALRRLLDLQDKFPNNAGIAAQIGVTQADLGHYDDAVRYMQIAASLEPQNPQHLFNIAVIADRKGAVADAIKYYEDAMEADAIYAGGRSLPRESIYDRLSKLRQR